MKIEEGETLVLMGTSGAGKSTLLKMINRLVEPDEGAVFVANRNVKEIDVQKLRRSIGYVIQQIGLFPHLSVAENITLSLKLAGISNKDRNKKADELLSFMGLLPSQFRNRLPASLSGGEQQRVGVARALATDPNILLLDEPFGALDLLTRAQLQEEILRLKALKKTIFLITHDLVEAFKLGSRIALMHNGSIEQVGTAHELYKKPQSKIVESFIKAGLSGFNIGE